MSSRQAAMSAVLADWMSASDLAGQVAHILDDGRIESPLHWAGLPDLGEQDDFSFGATKTPDNIGDLTMEFGRNPGRG